MCDCGRLVTGWLAAGVKRKSNICDKPVRKLVKSITEK